MVNRARMMPVMDGELTVKVLLIEDLIGLKLQALANDPKNRFAIDAADIQRLLKLHRNRLDIGLVREYFRLFEKEDLLNEWLGEAD
jgi:predicted nucleotidyltransferase